MKQFTRQWKGRLILSLTIYKNAVLKARVNRFEGAVNEQIVTVGVFGPACNNLFFRPHKTCVRKFGGMAVKKQIDVTTAWQYS